jgi:hypothetical protein
MQYLALESILFLHPAKLLDVPPPQMLAKVDTLDTKKAWDYGKVSSRLIQN